MYKAVIFDMGGVLIPLPKIWREYEKDSGLDPKAITRAILHIGIRETWCEAEKGEITLIELESRFADHCRELYNKPDLPQWPIFSRGKRWLGQSGLMTTCMTQIIKKIKQNGLKTAVVTNNFWFDQEKKDTTMYCDHELFDTILESCKLGMRKPDKPIYDLVLNKLDCKAEEVVFLDDLPWNIQTGKDMGMTTILVKDPEQAVAELKTILAIS